MLYDFSLKNLDGNSYIKMCLAISLILFNAILFKNKPSIINFCLGAFKIFLIIIIIIYKN